jgi:hypothetical protein
MCEMKRGSIGGRYDRFPVFSHSDCEARLLDPRYTQSIYGAVCLGQKTQDLK